MKALRSFETPGTCLPTDTAVISQNTLIFCLRDCLFVKLSHLVVRRIKEEFKYFFRIFLLHDIAGIAHLLQELAYGLGYEISLYSKTFSPVLEPIQPFI